MDSAQTGYMLYVNKDITMPPSQSVVYYCTPPHNSPNPSSSRISWSSRSCSSSVFPETSCSLSSSSLLSWSWSCGSTSSWSSLASSSISSWALLSSYTPALVTSSCCSSTSSTVSSVSWLPSFSLESIWGEFRNAQRHLLGIA